MTTVALAGATGLVGGIVLALALADDRVTRVIAPTRKPLPRHPKLVAPVVDFDALPSSAGWWTAHAGICALGTTRAQAGSADGFRRVDRGYPLAFARRLRDHGAERFVLVSAAGASRRSLFHYFRVKGDLEHDLTALGFASLTLLRPGLIDGERRCARPGERRVVRLVTAVNAVLPTLIRINPAPAIARAALNAALSGTPGRTIMKPSELTS